MLPGGTEENKENISKIIVVPVEIRIAPFHNEALALESTCACCAMVKYMLVVCQLTGRI
jgi:hypothetical protein